MAFRMRNTRVLPATPPDPPPIVINRPEKKYTQEELDMIDDKFKTKDSFLEQACQPVDNVTTMYKKSLEQSVQPIQKESIIFDPNVGRWKLIKK